MTDEDSTTPEVERYIPPKVSRVAMEGAARVITRLIFGARYTDEGDVIWPPSTTPEQMAFCVECELAMTRAVGLMYDDDSITLEPRTRAVVFTAGVMADPENVASMAELAYQADRGVLTLPTGAGVEPVH